MYFHTDLLPECYQENEYLIRNCSETIWVEKSIVKIFASMIVTLVPMDTCLICMFVYSTFYNTVLCISWCLVYKSS